MKAANEMFTKPAPAVKPGDLAVVVGAGVSGVAAAKLLHKLGARVRLLDRSLDRIPADFAEWAESAGVEIVCGEHSPSQFRDAKLVVPSPGVAAAVISKFLPDGTPPEIMAETELAWRQLSGEPVLGVTGTSGKTTTTSLCAAMLKEQGLTVFTGGNIGTPLSEYILSGEKADVVVLELSSFQLQTCSTLHPRVGILLNISENHLDFHKDMEDYCDAKGKLFGICDTGCVNADDPWTPRLIKNATCRLMCYSTKSAADLTAEHIALHSDGVEFDAVSGGERAHVRLGIPGAFTVYNALGVIQAAQALGLPLEKIAAALSTAQGVKGRAEVVPTPGKDYTVLIDYSHTPDSLENILKTVRGFCRGHVIAVFGCGGDRDPFKRPIMGGIAARLADVAVVTSDNPRTEDPNEIIRQIVAGMDGAKTPPTVIENRPKAIEWAMDHAEPGDVIVLCGKGHETYQEIGHEKRHLDEREVVASYLERTL